FSKNLAPAIIARVKVLANLRLDEHRLPQDGRFKDEIGGRKFSFRVSIMPVFDGEKAELRILEEEARIFSLSELGLTQDQQEIVKQALKKPFGMILSTGPTGSGKTTTLYTLLQMLNTRAVNIATIEDPVEYRIPGVNQTQIKPEIGLTFANGLRSLVRQDPNILMVGEIRDNETAALAIHAALTGHLVLSTLHTNNAAGAIPRLIDMKAESFLIASTASLIIAQRLVRRLCPEIKVPYKLSLSELAELGKSVNILGLNEVFRKRGILGPRQTLESVTFYRPGHSKECPDGYKGRIGIFEVLAITDKIRGLIFKGASGDEIASQARSEGMLTMQEAGFLAAAQGITSIEEVLRVTKE
ncbi:MAG: GspE/PulE family protein, partial [Candidatus Paceibacteria bacterium]